MDITWREQIKNIGGSKVARAMGVKYPTVHKYIKPGSDTLPRGKTRLLCRAMRQFLTDDEFEHFLNSLSSEIVSV